MRHLVARALELDRAEEELGRAFARTRRVETREAPREVDECDPHAGRGYRRRATDPRLPSTAMHRQHAKLAKRVNRVASSIERRGVVATYQVHDRFLGNRGSRRHYAAHPPVLDDVQRGLVEALDRDGYVSLRFADLVGEDVWKQVDEQGAAFIAETERTMAEGGLGKVRAGKEFVQRAYSFDGTTLGADNAVVRGVCVAADARRRERVPASLVEALLRRLLVHGAATRDGRARGVAELACRLRRQVPAQGVRLPVRRRPRPRAVRVRPGEPARRAPSLGAAVGADGLRPGGRRGRPAKRAVGRDRPLHGRQGDDDPLQHERPAPRRLRDRGPRVLATATYCSPASLKALSNRNFATTLETTDEVVRYAVS